MKIQNPSPMRSESPALAEDGTVQVSEDLIITNNILGRGSKGAIVYKGTYNGRRVAIKRTRKEYAEEADQEAIILLTARAHPNVIHLFNYFADNDFIYISLYECETTLADVIETPNHKFAKDLDKVTTLWDITYGLQYLHRFRIIHRNIEPRNVLIKSGWIYGDGFEVILCDFGLSVQLEKGEESYQPTVHGEGTLGWQAPEVLAEPVLGTDSGAKMPQKVGLPVDIWSLGCMVYYVMTNGKLPHSKGFERDSRVLESDRARMKNATRNLDKMANDLIKRTLAFDARHRPDVATCMKHAFFSKAHRNPWHKY